MYIRNCITSMYGTTCYEHISLIESSKTYLIFRAFEYIVRETIKEIDTKLVIQSLDQIAFS